MSHDAAYAAMLPGVELTLQRFDIDKVKSAEASHAALKMCYIENVMQGYANIIQRHLHFKTGTALK